MAYNEKSGGMKWFVIVVLIAVAIGGIAWFYKGKGDAKVEFTTGKITRGDLIQAVTATGTLNPVLKVEVGSQISGIIQRLYVDFNSLVKSNQIVAQLDPATYQANVSSAEGELANAGASLELAQVNARRAADLLKDKLISQADFDQVTATLHQTEAQVKVRSAALQRASVDLSRCTIYAPVDGIVIDRKVDVGQTVAASLSAPVLFQIANDLAKMQIDANVSEADVGSVEIGQDVDFTVDAFPFRTFHGKVVQVRNSPIIVQNVVTYDTVIEVANTDLKLKPGMTATVSIVVARREDVLKVPNYALRFRPPEGSPAAKTNAVPQVVAQAPASGGGDSAAGGGRRADGERRRGQGGNRARGEGRAPRNLYRLAGDPTKATVADLKPVQVKLGITDGKDTELLEGLNEGDSIVMSMTTTATNAPASNPFGGPSFPRR